jgi:general secretion pathway protein G
LLARKRRASTQSRQEILDMTQQPTHLITALSARARRARLARQGMTLIEIMIVVVIMALLATGVGIAVLPQLEKAKIQDTKAGVQAVRAAVQLYMVTNNAECATIEQLVEDKQLDAKKATKDAWDRDFQIECSGTEVSVTSAGPDGEFGGEDDIK